MTNGLIIIIYSLIAVPAVFEYVYKDSRVICGIVKWLEGVAEAKGL